MGKFSSKWNRIASLPQDVGNIRQKANTEDKADP